MTVKTSLVTVNYGDATRVADLSASIEKHCVAGEYEWIVVNNWSTEAHQKQVQKIVDGHDGAHCIALTQNIGFGAANNTGVKFAQGEYVFFVNPDICVKKNSFAPLMKILNTEKKALVAPQIVAHDGKRLENARKLPSLWHLFVRRAMHKTDCVNPHKTQSVDWVQGSFFGMHKAFFDALGGFDERFFLFLEDTDLCRRVWNDAGRVLVVPEAVVEHGEERLSGTNLLGGVMKKTFWIHLKSACVYFWKWKGTKKKATPEEVVLKV